MEYAKLNHLIQLNIETGATQVTSENEQPHDQDDSCDIAEDDNDLPTVDSLLIQLRTDVTQKWYQFGLAVGISQDVLNDLNAQFTSSEKCLIEVLSFWLKYNHRKPTWSDVACVLNHIKLTQLAEEILTAHACQTGK